MLKDFLFGLRVDREKLPAKLFRVAEHESMKPDSIKALKMPAGNEIRFMATGEDLEFKFDMGENSGTIEVYYGWFFHTKINLSKGINAVIIPYPERLKNNKDWYEGDFNPDVCRLLIRGQNVTWISKPEGIEAPMKKDIPKLTYLAYGTSITQGAKSSEAMTQYPSQVGRNLKANVINLGVRGSAYCEEAIAKYINKEYNWDFATLEISVNMLNQNNSVAEFKDVATRFIKILAEANPAKPIFCISLLPFFRDFGLGLDKEIVSNPKEYRETLEEICKTCGYKNIYYIRGEEILKDITGLSTDLIHPNDIGNIEIGRELAAKISEYIKV